MIHTATSWAVRQQIFMMAATAEAPSVKTLRDAARCEVKRGDVPFRLLDDIERTVRLASKMLGLDPAPRVRWLPANTRDIRGIVFDDTLDDVWVKVQEPDATRITALHELRHIHQLRGDRYLSMGLHTYEQRQRDADEFAATWTPWQTLAATPAPVGAHMQIAGFTFVRAADQEAARREWERKYKPLHDAHTAAVIERAQRGRRRY